MSTHSTESVRNSLNRAQVFEWCFRGLLLIAMSVAGFLAEQVWDDVKKVPESISQLRLDMQKDSASHVTQSEWTLYHTNFESRLAASENRQSVLENKLDTLAHNQDRTNETLDQLNRTVTGFQIDFNSYKPRK